MTDQKKPTEIADEALEDVTGGFYSMAGGGSELTTEPSDGSATGKDATGRIHTKTVKYIMS